MDLPVVFIPPAMSPVPPHSKSLVMTPHEALQRHFGFSGFLEGQEEVIKEITSESPVAHHIKNFTVEKMPLLTNCSGFRIES